MPPDIFIHRWSIKVYYIMENTKQWFDKPKFKNVKSTEGKTMPTGAWVKCPDCGNMMLKKQLEDNLNVCESCDHHFRFGARLRLENLLDKGSFKEKFSEISSGDPLKFTDASSAYPDKVKRAKEKLKMNEGIICGTGKIEEMPVIVAFMEFSFLGGSMGSGVGEKLYQSMLLAIKKKCPLITISTGGGARMHEGVLSLMQMGKTCAGLELMEEKGIPYISILTDPTTGGITASFASLGDVILAEPKALIGFAGPRVIEGTIKQKLPEGFQRSEFLLEHGFVDRVVHRREMREELARLLRFFS